ncbi:hypothetical protein [Nevskia sp.]|uniref:hypothetical protein n=1 Tax=Nevskia sp. TaxID=1929292 RepID=UPI003F6F8A19
MSLARYLASAPTNKVQHACLELSHPAWAAPHRRVIQPTPVTVSIGGVPTPFPGWNETGPWIGEYPAAESGGRAVRTLDLGDPDNAVFAQIYAVREHPEPVIVRLWLFLSDNLATPLMTERYKLQASAPAPERLALVAVSRDPGQQNDPPIRHTRMNSPGLRGR